VTAPALPTVDVVVALSRHTRVRDGGTTLVGGSPTRVLHLSESAARLLDGGTLRATTPVARALAERLVETGLANPVLAALPEVAADTVTVVVPVRDRPAQLDRLLDALGRSLRVVVVDDGSHEPAAVAAVVAAHGATLLPLSANVGPAGARNAGLAQVGTPYVAFVDSDVVATADAITSLLRHFADPRVALVAPRVMPLGGSSRSPVAAYEGARSSLDPGPDPALVRPRSRVSWVATACVVARVSALGAGFSDELRVAEDVDLVWRLCADDWRVRYEPDVRVEHEHRADLAAWLSRKAYYGTGAALLADRHGALVAPAVLSPWSVLAVGAALCQRRWSAPVVALTCAVVTARIARRVPRSRRPVRLAATLTLTGLGAASGQASALMLRHWWPLTLVACLVSGRARRAVVVAGLVDAAVEHRRTAPPLAFGPFLLVRRLDDLAYGAGVWMGALQARSVRALLPDLTTSRRRRCEPAQQ